MTFDQDRANRLLYLCRRTDEEIAVRYGGFGADYNPMQTPVHLSIGQEGAAVGVIMALPEGSHVFASHRNHAAYLAKGSDLDAMIAELYGRATGCCGGRGGSMHLVDEAVGFMGGFPIVGDAISLATGSALAAKLDGSDRTTAVFFGDAAVESGQLWESMNFAMLHGLRLLYVCENNGLATQTPISQRQPPSSIRYRVGRAVNLTHLADGSDVAVVYTRTGELLENLPAFLEVSVYRWKEHVGPGDDWDLGYRKRETL